MGGDKKLEAPETEVMGVKKANERTSLVNEEKEELVPQTSQRFILTRHTLTALCFEQDYTPSDTEPGWCACCSDTGLLRRDRLWLLIFNTVSTIFLAAKYATSWFQALYIAFAMVPITMGARCFIRSTTLAALNNYIALPLRAFKVQDLALCGYILWGAYHFIWGGAGEQLHFAIGAWFASVVTEVIWLYIMYLVMSTCCGSCFPQERAGKGGKKKDAKETV